jgi:hypothetical protein
MADRPDMEDDIMAAVWKLFLIFAIFYSYHLVEGVRDEIKGARELLQSVIVKTAPAGKVLPTEKEGR